MLGVQNTTNIHKEAVIKALKKTDLKLNLIFCYLSMLFIYYYLFFCTFLTSNKFYYIFLSVSLQPNNKGCKKAKLTKVILPLTYLNNLKLSVRLLGIDLQVDQLGDLVGENNF